MECTRRSTRNADADRPAGGAGIIGTGRPTLVDGDAHRRCADVREMEPAGESVDVAESSVRDRLSAFGNHAARTDARRASGLPFDGRAWLRLPVDRTHGTRGAALPRRPRRTHANRSRSIARCLLAAGRAHVAGPRPAPADRQESLEHAVPADDPAPVSGRTE